MEKSLTRQTFGVPSQGVLEHKFARLSEAENAYKTKLRDLEQQFESKAAALRRSRTRQRFGMPSQGVLEHKFARLSEAENAYKTKLRELEQQFESKAAALREAYLAAVLEIHEVATSSICYPQ
jgi:chromosome segregation ATPase